MIEQSSLARRGHHPKTFYKRGLYKLRMLLRAGTREKPPSFGVMQREPISGLEEALALRSQIVRLKALHEERGHELLAARGQSKMQACASRLVACARHIWLIAPPCAWEDGNAQGIWRRASPIPRSDVSLGDCDRTRWDPFTGRCLADRI